MPRKINIAIDGFSSTGKSTLARDLASRLGYRYIDTGAMYRAVTLYVLQNQLMVNGRLDEDALVASLSKISVNFQWSKENKEFQVALNGRIVEPEIRQMEVARYVSPVAAISEVRKFLVEQQKDMAREKGVVMDGRDITTVVMPDAELKIFVTASEKVRINRRYEELKARGLELSREEVAENLRNRDYLDSTREDSPLIKAADALLLDNSDLEKEEQLALALGWVREKLG